METVAICSAVFLGGIVSGFAGFAFSAVAGAILLHVLAPILAVPLMMSCTIVSQMTTLAIFRRFVDWREALPNPILTVQLKDWVEDFAGTLRRMLEFLDLPYDPACERFYERDSRVIPSDSTNRSIRRVETPSR